MLRWTEFPIRKYFVNISSLVVTIPHLCGNTAHSLSVCRAEVAHSSLQKGKPHLSHTTAVAGSSRARQVRQRGTVC